MSSRLLINPRRRSLPEENSRGLILCQKATRRGLRNEPSPQASSQPVAKRLSLARISSKSCCIASQSISGDPHAAPRKLLLSSTTPPMGAAVMKRGREGWRRSAPSAKSRWFRTDYRLPFKPGVRINTLSTNRYQLDSITAGENVISRPI